MRIFFIARFSDRKMFFLFYNSEPDVLGQGEMSRYLQQLVYESKLKIKGTGVAQHPVQPRQ